jgi:hypothetical protein
MKQVLLIIGYLIVGTNLTFGQQELCENCIEYTLELTNNKLQGSSSQLQGYDVSMILPSYFLKDSLTINYLFKTI